MRNEVQRTLTGQDGPSVVDKEPFEKRAEAASRANIMTRSDGLMWVSRTKVRGAQRLQAPFHLLFSPSSLYLFVRVCLFPVYTSPIFLYGYIYIFFFTFWVSDFFVMHSHTPSRLSESGRAFPLAIYALNIALKRFSRHSSPGRRLPSSTERHPKVSKFARIRQERDRQQLFPLTVCVLFFHVRYLSGSINYESTWSLEIIHK